MPCFHFNLHQAGRVVNDAEGQELANVEEAYQVAINDIRCIICDDLVQGTIDLTKSIEIECEGASMVVSFAEAMDQKPRPH